MTTFSVTITRTTKDTELASGVSAGAVRFQLLSAADNSVVATYDDASAGLLATFPGIEDASLIPSIQDLDSTGAALGVAVTAAAFTPSVLVSGSTPSTPVASTYAATAAITVSAVAEAAAAA